MNPLFAAALEIQRLCADAGSDWADVAGVVARRGPTLDVELVREELQPTSRHLAPGAPVVHDRAAPLPRPVAA